jgi:hypothetical protein
MAPRVAGSNDPAVEILVCGDGWANWGAFLTAAQAAVEDLVAETEPFTSAGTAGKRSDRLGFRLFHPLAKSAFVTAYSPSDGRFSLAAGSSMQLAIAPAVGPNTRVVVVLVAPPTSGAGWGEQHNDPGFGLDQPLYVVHADVGARHAARAILAHAVGRAFGLVEEWDDKTRGYPNPKRAFGASPNLIWVDPAFPTASLPVDWQAMGGPGYAGPWIGGGGDGTSVGRFAEHCIMRRRVGATAARVAADEVAFCDVCEHYLDNSLRATTSRVNRASIAIDRQEPKILTIWGYVPTQTAVVGTSRRPLAAPSDAHFAYDLHVDKTRGLWIAEVVGASLPYPSSHPNAGSTYDQDYLERCEFRTLKVKLQGDPSLYDFPIGTAFQQGNARMFTVESSTTRPSRDGLFQSGAYLVLEAVVGSATTARIQVEMCFAFRGGGADFDPAGAGRALKFWPEICFTRLHDPQHTAIVEQFFAETHYRVRVPMPPMLHPGSGGGHHAHHSSGNRVGFYTDANASLDPRNMALTQLALQLAVTVLPGNPPPEVQAVARAIEAIPVATAIWHTVFDYVRTDNTTELEFLAVPGPTHANFAATRSATLQWPTAANPVWQRAVTRTITKVPRQGDYDNIHLHGDMGAYGTTTLPLMMAPICAHACFHLHWRWANTNWFTYLAKTAWPMLEEAMRLASEAAWDTASWPPPMVPVVQGLKLLHAMPGTYSNAADVAHAIVEPSEYQGWTSNLRTARSGKKSGAPLIPPNQELRLSLTRDGTTSAVSPTQALNATEKSVWCRFTCTGPFISGERQVFGYSPVGLAYENIESTLLTSAMRPMLAWYYGDLRYVGDVPLVGTRHPIEKVFTDVYPMMRFLDEPWVVPALSAGKANRIYDVLNQVIPEGTELLTATTPVGAAPSLPGATLTLATL